MVFTLLQHQWISFWRSRNSGKSFAVQIILAIFLLYLVSCAALLGIVMPSIITHQYPNRNAIEIFCRFILYYFFVDTFFRFLIQELPTINIESYLTKNIRKKEIVRFLNIRSLFHFLNIIPLFLFIPFSISVIGKKYGIVSVIGFDLSVIFLTFFNHFLIGYIKRKSILKVSSYFIFIFAFALLTVLDYKNVLSISSFSAWIFIKIIAIPWLAIIPVFLFIGAYILNRSYLYKNLYLDELSKKQKRVQNNTEYTWLNKYGEIGDLLALEIKLITRNKRPKSLLVMSILFLLYGFIFYKPEYIHSISLGFLLFGAFFVTGMFSVAYGNFLFAWQSASFDGLITSKIQVKEYVKSKIYFLFLGCTISFILSNLYGIMSWKLILIQFVAYLFNVGINNFIMAYLSTFNYKFVDISQKAAFNYSGTGMVQWVYMLVIMILPAILYAIPAFIWGNWVGIATIGTIGLISLICSNIWIDFLTKEFNKRRYKISEGFRER